MTLWAMPFDGRARAQGTAAPEAGSRDATPLPKRAAIRFLTEADYPPFHYYDEDGTLVGFNVDLARAICLELAAACDIQVRPWDQLLAALKRGESDAVIASHAITTGALRHVDFSDQYYLTPARFVARRGGAGLAATPDGLEGKRIGVAKGTAHEAYLRTFFRNSRITTFENQDVARDALTTSSVDLVFDDGIGLVFWLNGTASKGCCEFLGGPFFEPKYFGDGVGIALKKDDAELKVLINAALKKVRSTGRYEELMLRYFPIRAD
jgi:polar amino acid transport system substrate-binding protein